jgi:hypothetical protein
MTYTGNAIDIKYNGVREWTMTKQIHNEVVVAHVEAFVLSQNLHTELKENKTLRSDGQKSR